MNEEIIGKIIDAAYGSAGLKDRRFVRKLIKKNAEAARIFNEYSQTARKVHSIKPEECPPELSEALKIGAGKSPERSVYADLYALIFTKPAYSFSAALFSLIVVISAMMVNRNQPEQYFTQTQILAADEQTKEALAFVSSLFKKSGEAVTKDVLIEHVSKPLNEGINVVNKLFIEGENK